MKRFLWLLPLLLLILPVQSRATLVTGFAQTSAANTVSATDDGTTTTITITDATVNLAGGLLIGNGVDFTLTAVSIDPVQTVGPTGLLQHYNGSFSIFTGPSQTGVDLLSGTFTDAAFGAGGGPGLVVNVNNPPDTLSLSSDILTPSQLQAPSNLNLTFTNLSPSLGVDGTTIAGFNASFTGNVSASEAVPASEPSTIALLGVALLSLGFLKWRQGNAW